MSGNSLNTYFPLLEQSRQSNWAQFLTQVEDTVLSISNVSRYHLLSLVKIINLVQL